MPTPDLLQRSTERISHEYADPSLMAFNRLTKQSLRSFFVPSSEIALYSSRAILLGVDP